MSVESEFGWFVEAVVDQTPDAPSVSAAAGRGLRVRPLAAALSAFVAVIVVIGAVALLPRGEGPVGTTQIGGLVYSQSDCPGTESLLIGGVDHADGLPMKGQTDPARVSGMLPDIRERFAATPGVVTVEMIERNGEVWSRTDDGVIVERVEDSQFQMQVDTSYRCPVAPLSLNGVPVVYRID